MTSTNNSHPDALSEPGGASPALAPTKLWVCSWPDPVIDVLGHDPRSSYVESYWLPILGPSTTWLARSLVASLEASPTGYVIDLSECAATLGLGDRGGRHSPFRRALIRLTQFELAQYQVEDTLAIRRRVPPLSRHQAARLRQSLQASHAALVESEASLPPDEHLRRRSRQLALSLVELGEDFEAAEAQLVRWRFAPTLAREAANWAWDRHCGRLSTQEGVGLPDPSPVATSSAHSALATRSAPVSSLSAHQRSDPPATEEVALMMIRSAATIGQYQLERMLRAGADGDLSAAAAVELLIAHQRWLAREDFLHHVLVGADPPVASPCGFPPPVIAKVDWAEALDADLPASSSELQVLAICAELAGTDSGRPLGALLSGLDDSNTVLVLRAVLSAHPGWRRVDRLSVSPLPNKLAPSYTLGAIGSATLSRAGAAKRRTRHGPQGPEPDACA
ncbi:MAG: hypothetical protein ACRDWV_10705 [Acidimicrobiales bacterium]